MGCYKRLRRQIPAYAEVDRAQARAWKARNRDRMRAYDAVYAEQHRGTCEACGGRMGAHVARDGICEACRRAGVALRRELIVELWADGRTLSQIAEALGSTKGSIQVEMVRMRQAGYDLPYRRTPEQVQRIRDGCVRSLSRRRAA